MQQKVLILAGISHGLRLDKEIREIEEAIRRSARRDKFEVRMRTAIRPQDIRRAIAEEGPQIVHFCGHGLEDGSLLLEDDGGNDKPVSGEVLAKLFELHADYVNCVLLNACHSAKLAEAISQYINYAIGMNQEIKDKPAIAFVQGFYDALGYETSDNIDIFKRAFREGLVAIGLEDNSEGEIPVLKILNQSTTDSQTQPFPPKPSIAIFEFEVVIVDIEGRETKRSSKQAKYFIENLGGDIALEMVSIPEGKFSMGASKEEGASQEEERPQHIVSIRSFFMGKYPITQAQWRVVANLPKVNRNLNPEPSYFQGKNLPVERVCWHDAQEFCQRISQKTGRRYRLPSEAEWEYACRARTSTPFYFGKTLTASLANYCKLNGDSNGACYQQTTEVGSFPANNFGLYDMHGLVWEWCADYDHEDYVDAPSDGNPWLKDGNREYRILRGGSWDSPANLCRSAARFSGNPSVPKKEYGFRVVCS